MKKCSYCGAQYPDDLVVCPIDDTPFDKVFQAKRQDTFVNKSTLFGKLSVAAPLIGVLLIFMCSPHYDSIEVVFCILALSALVGFASAITAWIRHEKYWGLRLIGLLLNLAVLLIAGGLLLP